MKINILKFKALIFIAIAVSFLFTIFIVPNIFVSGTPQINTQFIAQLRQSPLNLMALLRRGNNRETDINSEISQDNGTNSSFSYITPEPGFTKSDYEFTAQISKTKHPTGLKYVQIAKGVSAADDPQSDRSFIKIEKGVRIEKREVILDNGQAVTIYIPLE